MLLLSVLPLAVPLATGASCPGSPAIFHASCTVAVAVEAPCAAVKAEMVARVKGQAAHTWVDPHNNGSYAIVADTPSTLDLTHLSGNGKYTDKLRFTFDASGTSTCLLHGCSESQVISFADFSTNYCNLRMLYCAKADGCHPLTANLDVDETAVSPSAGAGTDASACLTVVLPTAQLKVAPRPPQPTLAAASLALAKPAAAAPSIEAATYLIAAAAAPPSAAAAGDACPSVGTQDDLDLGAFVGGGKWYIHQQMEVLYLPKNQNYCVTAEYSYVDKNRLKVHNYANEGGVNGKVFDSDDQLSLLGGICADVVTAPAKLSVGPCRLPSWLPGARGPYWVVAAGGSAGKYEWALISGGQPTIRTKGGCRTGHGVNGAGLWIFSRSPARDDALLDKVRQIAMGKGFDVSVLNDVDQKGCLYKPPPS